MKDTGDPAFPTKRVIDGFGNQISYDSAGMSLRDYFAAKAMQALIGSGIVRANDERTTAIFAIKYADALLEELGKGGA